MAELNDSKISELGIKKIKRIIDGIINDNESTAGQGMFWNVLVPKEIPFVLKTERKLYDESQEKYRRKSLLQYPIIRDSIGKEFLPKQAVLLAHDSERFYVLQEKMPLQKMTSIRNKNIDSVIAGDYGQEIVNALSEEKNKEKLREFISGVERLYKDHKLIIDTVGDNLFFNVSEGGDLNIKLVDYGAFKQRGDVPNSDIKEVLVFLEKLTNLL
ncbi:hypothetical protein EPN15_03460 [Patescibacteria group bacterium]|nr:MAG: hypothetical protein EPN15_03460 [Patescibacteria group bacterium]